MAETVVSPKDIATIFKRLKTLPDNKTCFDCGHNNPTWASVTYGVFLCIDCSAVHRSLGVHLTFIRSTQLDTNWTWLQLRAMQVGGNAKANAFFRQHNLSTEDSGAKYRSRVAQMYREKLATLAARALQQYGTQLHIDGHGTQSPHSPDQKEHDFFKDVVNQSFPQTVTIPTNGRNSNGNGNDLSKNMEDLSVSPPKHQEARVPTIGTRKPAAKKKGLGTKKGGLGATKVSTNFSELESRAQQMDKDKEKAALMNAKEAEAELISPNLAYNPVNYKKEEEKLRHSDPKKAAQLERLGMGLGGGKRGASTTPSGRGHSASAAMETVEQVRPTNTQPSFADKLRVSSNSNMDFFDSYGMDGTSFTEPSPMYDSPFGSGSWDRDSDRDRDKDRGERSSFSSERRSSREERSNRKRDPEPVDSGEAQKKFGNAKSISSAQFYGNQDQEEFAIKSRLDRYQGSNSVSSADLFGDDDRPSRSNASGTFTSADLSQLKDGMARVTGKLSSMASGVIGTLQNRYSGSS